MGRNERDESTNILTKGNNAIRFGEDNGFVQIGNATNTVTISNVAPAAVTTATINSWMAINIGGTDYYIPLWT